MNMDNGKKKLILLLVLLLGVGLTSMLARRPDSVPAAQPLPAVQAMQNGSIQAPPTMQVYVNGAVARPGIYTLPTGSRVHDALAAAGGFLATAKAERVNLAKVLKDGSQVYVPEQSTKSGKANKSKGQSAAYLPAAGSVRITPSTQSKKGVEGEVALGQYNAQGQQQVQNNAGNGGLPQVQNDYGNGGLPQLHSNNGAGVISQNQGSSACKAKIDINKATQQELESLPGIGPALAKRIIQYRDATPFTSVEQLVEVRGIGPAKLAAMRSLVQVQP